MKAVRLGDVARCRSGDKGNHANLAVIAIDPRDYDLLKLQLTTERIKAFFCNLGASRVERFELPNIFGLNFVLHDALGGGASQSLRTDTQGKLLGTAALEIMIEKPQ